MGMLPCLGVCTWTHGEASLDETLGRIAGAGILDGGIRESPTHLRRHRSEAPS